MDEVSLNPSQNNPNIIKKFVNNRKTIAMFFLFSLVSAIIFGYFNLPGLGLIWLFACGDVACGPIQLFEIAVVLISSLITFMLPGIFIFSILYKKWKFPLYPLVILSCIFLFQMIFAALSGRFDINTFVSLSIRDSGFLRTILNGPIWTLFMISLYAISLFLISLSIHDLSNLAFVKRYKYIVIAELLLFIALMAFNAFAPTTIKRIEQTASPALKKDKLPFGTIYYQYPHDPRDFNKKETIIGYLDSEGNTKTIQISQQCGHTMISWNQRSLICFTIDGKWWLVDLTSKSQTKLNLEGYPANQYSWSKTGRYLILTQGDQNSGNLYRFDLQDKKQEKLNNEPLVGNVKEAIFSSNDEMVLYIVETGTYPREKPNIRIYDMKSKTTKEIKSNPICDGIQECGFRDHQFSLDNTRIYYYTKTEERTSQSDYKYTFKFGLVNIQTQEVSELIKTETNDNGLSFFYDGDNSVIIRNTYDNSVKKVNIINKSEKQLKYDSQMKIDSSYIALDGEWILTRLLEIGNYVTYAQKFDTTERYRILNNNEFPLSEGLGLNGFTYWFR